MPAPDPQTAALIRGYNRTVTELRRRVVALVLALWDGLDDYHDQNIERWIASVVPILDAAQQQTANLTAAYLATFQAVALDTPARHTVLPRDVATTTAMRGLSTADMLRRPAVEVYTQLANQVPFPEAVARGGDRATSLVETNLQLAKTHTAQHVTSTNRHIVGHRRSLSGARSCALCIVASTQRYKDKDLQPIHPGCDCGVIPIYDTKDPGQVIDSARLADVHNRIADRFGAFESGAKDVPGVNLEGSGDPTKYRDVLVVHDHGEIGPVLGVRGQDFTGPNDL